MASSRLIDSNLFEDDFVGGLSFFDRLVWIGLFGAVADDQGRFMDNPALVRAKVFLYDANVTDDMVDKAMDKIATAGKIIRYSVSGKRLCQVVNWWKYQHPSWASESRYQAPEGWTDRIKAHVQGNKVVVKNWDTPGGFITLPSELPSQLHRPINEDEGKDKDKVGEDKDKSNLAGAAAPAAPAPSPAAAASFSTWNSSISLRQAERMLLEVSNLAALPGGWSEKLDGVYQAIQRYGQDQVADALREARTAWTSKRRGDGVKYSPLNPAWIDWAYAKLSGDGPLVDAKPMTAQEKAMAYLNGG